MKKLMVFLIAALMLVSFSAFAGGKYGNRGPAPNSGDCIPDGSGYVSPNGPNGKIKSGSGNGHRGPAPNSGDGIPDGSGFETTKNVK